MKMIAITEIWKGSGRMIPTGEFDRHGNPKLEAETIITHTGAIFYASEEEAADLLSVGAARPVDDDVSYSQRADFEHNEEQEDNHD